MGFFRRDHSRGNGSPLPPDIGQMMERFGRYESNPQASREDPSYIGSIVATLYPIATANPGGFLGSLAQAVLPTGGWAVYGASCTVWELLGSDSQAKQHPAYKAIMDAGVGFLRANGIPPMRVRGYEWDHWLSSGGTTDTWLPRRPIPSLDEASITALLPSEVRKVVQMTAEPDSNLILVRQNSDGQYCALIDAKWSDEDPRRVQREWKLGPSLYDLYIEIGLSQQTPTYWYDKEMEPYFPLPRPRF